MGHDGWIVTSSTSIMKRNIETSCDLTPDVASEKFLYYARLRPNVSVSTNFYETSKFIYLLDILANFTQVRFGRIESLQYKT